MDESDSRGDVVDCGEDRYSRIEVARVNPSTASPLYFVDDLHYLVYDDLLFTSETHMDKPTSKIYQDDSPVADVIGGVVEEKTTITFGKLTNAQIDTTKPIQYGRHTLQCTTIGKSIGMQVSGAGTESNILEDVVCTKLP